MNRAQDNQQNYNVVHFMLKGQANYADIFFFEFLLNLHSLMGRLGHSHHNTIYEIRNHQTILPTQTHA